MRKFPQTSFLACAAAIGSVAICVSSVAVTPAGAAPAAPTAGRVAAAPLVFNASAAVYGKRNSPSVRNLQILLIRRGYATPGLRRAGATGAYLGQTRSSVRKLQNRLGFRGADADGIIGRTSATKLGLRWVTTSSGGSGGGSDGGSSPAPTSSSNPGTALSAVQLKSVLHQAGFREPAIRTAWAVVMRESRAYPRIASKQNSNGTRDHGLFQINDIHRSYVNFARIYEPVYNAQVAYGFTRRGVDFSAWGLGTTGWAGQLKKLYPSYWAQLRDDMLAWRAKYPG